MVCGSSTGLWVPHLPQNLESGLKTLPQAQTWPVCVPQLRQYFDCGKSTVPQAPQASDAGEGEDDVTGRGASALVDGVRDGGSARCGNETCA